VEVTQPCFAAEIVIHQLQPSHQQLFQEELSAPDLVLPFEHSDPKVTRNSSSLLTLHHDESNKCEQLWRLL